MQKRLTWLVGPFQRHRSCSWPGVSLCFSAAAEVLALAAPGWRGPSEPAVAADLHQELAVGTQATAGRADDCCVRLQRSTAASGCIRAGTAKPVCNRARVKVGHTVTMDLKQ